MFIQPNASCFFTTSYCSYCISINRSPPHHSNSILENILTSNLSLVSFGQVIFQTKRLKTGEERYLAASYKQWRAMLGRTPRFPAPYPACRGKPWDFCSFSFHSFFLPLTISHVCIVHVGHFHTSPFHSHLFPAGTLLLPPSPGCLFLWHTKFNEHGWGSYLLQHQLLLRGFATEESDVPSLSNH